MKAKLLLILLSLSFILPAYAGVPTSISFYGLPQEWTATTGETVKLSDFRGKQVVLSLIYTECTRVCPVTIQSMKKIEKVLKEQNKEAELILVTLDPRTDTLAKLSRFQERHELNRKPWHFLRGSKKDTQLLAQYMGAKAWDYYSHVVHNLKILLLDPQGQVVESIGWNDEIEKLTDAAS
ncbi:MAG: SCO family protein [Bdellovibrionales bacterium]|nr:SCO family protein [Bdellovibrionales bacterium]